MDDDRNDYYALGTYSDFNGTWIPDNADIDVGIGLRYDYGKFYASKTFYDQEKKRRILWGWITEGDSEAADIKKGWASLQAIPRTILYDQKTKTNLIQWPVEEIETLRQNSKEFNQIEVPAGSIVPLDVSGATEIDIMAEFNLNKEALERLPVSEENYSCPSSKGASQRGALGPFGFLVLADDYLSEQTPVYFYVVKSSNGSYKTFFCTDLSRSAFSYKNDSLIVLIFLEHLSYIVNIHAYRSSIAPDVIKEIYGSTVPVLKGETLSMRILVDHSIVEAFAQGGRSCITSRVYPTKAIYKDAKLYLFNNATTESVTASIKTWQMSAAHTLCYSIWAHLMIILSTYFFIGRSFF
ncbi:Acid beta-fructofuranosidase 2 vacuolar [Bienertia sinuspersici]